MGMQQDVRICPLTLARSLSHAFPFHFPAPHSLYGGGGSGKVTASHPWGLVTPPTVLTVRIVTTLTSDS